MAHLAAVRRFALANSVAPRCLANTTPWANCSKLKESGRKKKKANSLSFAFFYFSESRGFPMGYGRKKWKKCLPPAFRLRVAFSTSTASLFSSSAAHELRTDPAQTLSSISLFRKSNRGSYSAGCWSITLPGARMLPRRGRARRGHPRERSHPSVGVHLCPYLWAPRPPASAMRGLPAAAAMAAKGLRRRFGRDLYQDFDDRNRPSPCGQRANARPRRPCGIERDELRSNRMVLVAIVARK